MQPGKYDHEENFNQFSMNVGWSAYVWWYIRRSYGPMDENGNIQKLGYVMAQYARYVRPGYTKISCLVPSSISVSGGDFEVSLPAMSVTTIVSD